MLSIGLGILAVILLLTAITDTFWPLSLATVLGIAALIYFGGWAALWLLWHPVWIAGYAVAGLVWVIYRWHLLVSEKLREAKRSAYANQNPPTWRAHSGSFAAYFFYWPFDAVAYVLRDLLVDVWDAIASMVSNSFNRYAEYRFRALKGDEK